MNRMGTEAEMGTTDGKCLIKVIMQYTGWKGCDFTAQCFFAALFESFRKSERNTLIEQSRMFC